jgi:hypothetical protein
MWDSVLRRIDGWRKIAAVLGQHNPEGGMMPRTVRPGFSTIASRTILAAVLALSLV